MSKKDDYEIGYGKPPKQHQFKPGRSGNPKGRQRRATTKAEIIAKVRSEPIAIVINGQRRWVDPFEAALRATVQQCLKHGRVADLSRLDKMLEEKGYDWRSLWREETERSANDAVSKIMQMASRVFDGDPNTLPENNE